MSQKDQIVNSFQRQCYLYKIPSFINLVSDREDFEQQGSCMKNMQPITVLPLLLMHCWVITPCLFHLFVIFTCPIASATLHLIIFNSLNVKKLNSLTVLFFALTICNLTTPVLSSLELLMDFVPSCANVLTILTVMCTIYAPLDLWKVILLESSSSSFDTILPCNLSLANYLGLLHNFSICCVQLQRELRMQSTLKAKNLKLVPQVFSV